MLYLFLTQVSKRLIAIFSLFIVLCMAVLNGCDVNDLVDKGNRTQKSSPPSHDIEFAIDVVNGQGQKIGDKDFWAYAQEEQVELHGLSRWTSGGSTWHSNLVGEAEPWEGGGMYDWNGYFDQADGYRITTCDALNSALIILWYSDIKLKYNVSTRLFSVDTVTGGGGWVQLDPGSYNRLECKQ
ncbi:MAG: hypothetical protein JNN12_16800 [Bacteroidetes Order II. Incertae sedis bacterium]|nr:hypothetical protein [Bacteroidetes Order II. bacterium]